MMSATRITLPGDGVAMVADAYGDPAAPPVCFFHGGGQSRRSWAGSARRVAQAGYYGLTFDLRGHGDSGWASNGDYLLEAYGRDVEAILFALDRPVALVGASRGGQSALVGGSRHPDRVRLIMLADVAPHIDDAGVEEIRSFFHASAAGFASLDEAADALHLHLGQPRLPDVSGLAKAMRTDGGRLFWHWDPRTTSREFLHPPSEGEALVAAAQRVTAPVVLVRAELSEIVTDESISQFQTLTPQLEVEVAYGVGHMFTGDHNDAFADRLLRHLGRHLPL
ncbi:alpha/beta hydrolase [Sphingobium sp.]|uniref:alpha/beta fold hydrolase n=1 Tax=Sphingobium TaxID=165695 RepID=UPI001A1B4911|nr:alpha/beta hydrolase [Sphingobium sp.]MBJ7376931.1 alpha/beta hydrolase [Sphingobium sp.]